MRAQPLQFKKHCFKMLNVMKTAENICCLGTFSDYFGLKKTPIFVILPLLQLNNLGT